MSYIRNMETIKVELPMALLKTANPNSTDHSKEAARLLALELFREQKVSLSRAAELCDTPLAAFMDFVSSRDVSPMRYELGELEQDRQTLADLGL